MLSVSAAAGFRFALPLLLIGLLSGNSLWSDVPILSRFSPSLVVGVLVSWSLLELILSKDRPVRRFLQTLELLFSPFAGAIAGIALARTTEQTVWLIALCGIIGSLIALVIQLVQVGWLYRIRRPPLRVLFLQDFLCICLVFLAFDAPQQGGLIALLLLWLAIRTSNLWRRWYLAQAEKSQQHRPRQYKHNPD